MMCVNVCLTETLSIKKANWHLCGRESEKKVMNKEVLSLTPHLLLILPSGRVQRLDESCCMADENGIAGSSHNHTQHGEPDIREALRGLSAVANAQHVAHCLEHSKGVQLRPGIIL